MKTLLEMLGEPMKTLLEMLGDWCYKVTVRTPDGYLARPNIQAPNEDDCRKRIAVLYPDAEILAIDALHRVRGKFHSEPAVQILRRKHDPRPAERPDIIAIDHRDMYGAADIMAIDAEGPSADIIAIDAEEPR